MMNTYRYATRAILTLFFFTITIISTVSGEVIHFGSNMVYVPDEVSQRDYISDEDLLKVVEDIEQQQSGGGAGGSGEESSEGFFNFKRVPFREKTAKSYGIKRTSYHLNLENPQSTFPIGHRKIIRAFEEGLANSIRDLIVGLPDHDRIQIYIGSNRLRNSHTTANVSVEQWRDPMGASRQVLSNISNLLNSNENFEIDDTLQLDVTHITMPPPGSGLPKGKRKRHIFGTDNYGDFLKAKRSVIRIMNDDELCCARAIVVAKAIVDDHPQVNPSKIPALAQQLQEEARVPLGPCGLDQIKLFEIILCDYQFVVISAEHGHSIVHKGPESNKQIKLLMHDGHFDVITKLPGFFNFNYYCLRCEKAYTHEDYSHHSCHRTTCHACFRFHCRDYELFKHTEKPELPCKNCNRHFYGVTCQLNHLTQKSQWKSCSTWRKKCVSFPQEMCHLYSHPIQNNT